VIAYAAGSGKRLVEKRPGLASLGEPLTNARRAFRNWRRTRPFWGGLLVIVGASELVVSEQAPLSGVTHIGIQNLGYLSPGFMLAFGQAPLPGVADNVIQSPGAYLTPGFMLICGVLLWLTPFARIYHSLLAILLALWSWITSNLGGFVIGMLIGAIGGALAFAWMTDAQYESSGSLRSNPGIRLLCRALDVISWLKPRVIPQQAEQADSELIDIVPDRMLGRQPPESGGSLIGKVVFFVRARQSLR
jgi:hypothetical protein